MFLLDFAVFAEGMGKTLSAPFSHNNGKKLNFSTNGIKLDPHWYSRLIVAASKT